MVNIFKGKKILVTGGTGSIGSEVVKQLLKYDPATIRVFARGEKGHYLLSRELGDTGNKVRFIVGDVRDKDRLRLAMEGIDIVFHAAAIKHVDICEDNPFEAVRTNILGTQNVIDIAREFNLEKVIAVSTDKVVDPHGVLGASKLMAEKLILNSYYYQGSKRTIFACVRFGNVLGSSGSLLQTFRNQIREGERVTITDPEMTRFFMTIPQAVKLLLDVSELASGQEIFVLKMPSVKIGLLADCAIDFYSNLFKKNPKTIKKVLIGPRKGEKKHESLVSEHEAQNALATDSTYILLPRGGVWGFSYDREHVKAKPVKDKHYHSEKAPKLTKKGVLQLLEEVDPYVVRNSM